MMNRPGCTIVVMSLACVVGKSATTTKPHLDGIFLSINNATSQWTQQQWREDLTAMARVEIKFFCPRALVVGTGEPPTAECPLGFFETYYEPSSLACMRPAPNMPINGTLTHLMSAARDVGLDVHLGLALPAQHVLENRTRDSLFYRQLAWLQWTVAQDVWESIPNANKSTVKGIYTVLEESNEIGSLEQTQNLAGHYLEPLSRDIKANISDDLLVWASPYYVGNLTRHRDSDIMDPDLYAEWWGAIFRMAPHLDFIAPQDSMGANGNSFQNVTDYLTAIARVSHEVGREVWSNVELFEVWPMNCTGSWSHCSGRHPGPIKRITEQIANEANIAPTLIAWEWHSCLSPYAQDLSYGSAIKATYDAYLAYVQL
eukprot:m.764847 g.764847  ORF g.764847 m.764847 type:complete len:372 (-) comp23217_c0_seq39:1653-2768(-)